MMAIVLLHFGRVRLNLHANWQFIALVSWQCFTYSSHFVPVWKRKYVLVRMLSVWQKHLTLNLVAYDIIYVFNGQVISKRPHQFKVFKRKSLQTRQGPRRRIFLMHISADISV